jgi:hypothetical protein
MSLALAIGQLLHDFRWFGGWRAENNCSGWKTAVHIGLPAAVFANFFPVLESVNSHLTI